MKDIEINIAGIDKAKLLRDLYNAAAHFSGSDPNEMTLSEAQDIWHASPTAPHIYDVVRGRVLKVDLMGEGLDPRWYDRHNGSGKCGEVVAALRG